MDMIFFRYCQNSKSQPSQAHTDSSRPQWQIRLSYKMRRNDFNRQNVGFHDNNSPKRMMGRQSGFMGNQNNSLNQPGLMGSPPGLMGNQPGLMGNQPRFMNSPPNLMGNQPNLMGNQQNLMGNQPNLMGNQQNLMGNQPSGLFGNPPSLMGNQQGFMGNQPGGMGNQPNFMGNQPNLMGNQQNLMGNQQNLMGNQPNNLMGNQPNNMMGNQPNFIGNQPNLMGNQPNLMGNPPNLMGNQQGQLRMPQGGGGNQGGFGGGQSNQPFGVMNNQAGPLNLNNLFNGPGNLLGQNNNQPNFLGGSPNTGIRPPSLMGQSGPPGMMGPPGPGQNVLNRIGNNQGGIQSLLGTPIGMGNQQDGRGLGSGDQQGNRNNFRRPDNRGNFPGNNRFARKRSFSNDSGSSPSKTTQNLSGGGDDKSKPFFCQVCRVQLSSVQDFHNHLNSPEHKRSSGLASTSGKRELNQGFQSRNRITGSGDNKCIVCNRNYISSYYVHSMTTEHKNRAKLISRGCLMCNVGKFVMYTDYVQHLDSAKHKENKAELNKRNHSNNKTDTKFEPKPSVVKTVKKVDPVKKDSVKESLVKKDAEKIETEKVEEEQNPENSEDPEVKAEEADEDTDTNPETASKMEETAEGDGVMVQMEELVYDPEVAVGQEHVISVTGYFCKLCHKFYNNEAMAKVNHCKTEVHFEKYKDSLAMN